MNPIASLGRKPLDVNTLQCGVLATGGVGCGKSSGFARRLLRQILRNTPKSAPEKVGGLLLGPSGNLENFAHSEIAAAGREKDIRIISDPNSFDPKTMIQDGIIYLYTPNLQRDDSKNCEEILTKFITFVLSRISTPALNALRPILLITEELQAYPVPGMELFNAFTRQSRTIWIATSQTINISPNQEKNRIFLQNICTQAHFKNCDSETNQWVEKIYPQTEPLHSLKSGREDMAKIVLLPEGSVELLEFLTDPKDKIANQCQRPKSIPAPVILGAGVSTLLATILTSIFLLSRKSKK